MKGREGEEERERETERERERREVSEMVISMADASMAYPCGADELEVVLAEGVVVDGGVDAFLDQDRVSEEVLGDAEPEPEELYARSIEGGSTLAGCQPRMNDS